ncbi:hypothetical protein [Vibrio fluvialis]|uniref:hypothetical protein n=1 Tax=Vibrio fluvialis TaxID=676 RepID=UPI001F32D880|nr:hypothetical protein [Vibrio fluvialis]MCE7607057.1 hypothetical protein [Vibrio fluvialis]
MTVDESSLVSVFDIHYQRWTLRVARVCPTRFQLLHGNQLMYEGTLELTNNGEVLDVSHAQWKFRHRPDRIEQWCQWHHAAQLSLNMNYYFHQDAVVIEYLARNSIPTRLDIRHVIQPLDAARVMPPSTDTAQPDWQRTRHGLPSDFIRQSAKTDWFREAFSATQWIVLGKV